jgi:hypothetical protein
LIKARNRDKFNELTKKDLESIVTTYFYPLIARHEAYRAKSATKTKVGDSDGQYFSAWSYSQYQEEEKRLDTAAEQYRLLSQTESTQPVNLPLSAEDTAKFQELRKNTEKHLSDCARIFELSVRPDEDSTLSNIEPHEMISSFKTKYPNIEKNFLAHHSRGDDLKFTYQRGLKEAINFYEHNGIFAEHESYRIAIPHRPFLLSPFGIYSWMLKLSRHFNDTYWNGFLETAFYIGAKCPSILDYDDNGPIEPSYHSNFQIRYQLMILKIMDRVRDRAGIAENDDYSQVDPTNRTAMICATYHQMIIDSRRPNSNDQALLIRKGHNPITCMLRMIQKNHHLTSEILDPGNNIPFREELADALLQYRPSRVRINFEGTEIETTANLRWYEVYGKKYEYIVKAFKAYKDKSKSSIGSPGLSWLYVIPYALLSILLWFLPDPEDWREEGRLNEFGLGRRGLERIAYSAKQLYKSKEPITPQHKAHINTYLENFTESSAQRERLNQ